MFQSYWFSKCLFLLNIPLTKHNAICAIQKRLQMIILLHYSWADRDIMQYFSLLKILKMPIQILLCRMSVGLSGNQVEKALHLLSNQELILCTPCMKVQIKRFPQCLLA